MRIIIFILFFEIYSLNVVAQQPAHFNWGEEELSGVDIYGLHQDKKGDYWIATNKGLYKYDGREIVSLSIENPKSSSIFNLIESPSGEIFFNNLSGQIFIIEGDTCKVYYELPDSLISPYINIQFDDNNDLLVSAKHLFKLSEDKDIEILYEFAKIQFSDLLVRSDGGIYFHPQLEDYYCIWKDGILSKIKVKSKLSKDRLLFVSAFIEFDGKLYCYGEFDLYLLKNEELIPTGISTDKNELDRFCVIDNKLCLLKSTRGFRILDVNNPSNRNQVLFKTDFISNVLEDREGNILLGTFGSGIKFIPFQSVMDYNLPDNENIENMTLGFDSIIYYGTESGKVYSFNNKGKSVNLISGLKKSIEFLEWIPSQKQLCIGEFGVKMYETKSGEIKGSSASSLKDIFIVNDSSLLFATNMGVVLNKLKKNVWSISHTLQFTDGVELDLSLLNNRTYSVVYDSVNRSIYAATNNGLVYLSSNGKVSELKFNKKTISTNNLHYWKGKIYANQQENGVLVIENGLINQNWKNVGHVHQIESNEKWIVFSTNEGILIYGVDGDKLKSYSVSDGLYSNKVNDFIVFGDEIWVAHQRGLQKIIIDPLSLIENKPQVEISQLFVNGAPRNLLQIDYPQNENRFQFVLNSPSKRNKEETKYTYQLEGIDDSWLQENYYNNTIEYKSLPPGNYKFKVKSIYRGIESETVQFPFNIDYPYYQKVWFYLVLILMGMGVLALIFKIQLNRQKKKASQQNELNASKLTAIQSQMNPHFIFNALNSIQDLVLKGDVDNSYTYITKFANLVRRTLNYSDKDFIDFESEIKLIDLYLTLEKLRFKKEFNYEIITNEIDDVLVPPMLVQPFIENALVHGLLHKKGQKHIRIEFKLEKELVCTITDNGIGRAKAMEIKQRQRSDHESFSVDAIKKRFEILKDNFGGSLGFEYVDLIEDEVPLGTKVILRIPVKRVL